MIIRLTLLMLLSVISLVLSACSNNKTTAEDSNESSGTEASTDNFDTDTTTENSDTNAATENSDNEISTDSPLMDTPTNISIPKGFLENDIGLWFYPEYDILDDTDNSFAHEITEEEYITIMDNFIYVILPDGSNIIDKSGFNQEKCDVTIEHRDWKINISYNFRGANNKITTCLVEYLGTATELTVPTTIGVLNVTSIYHDALATNDTVKEFTIPDNDFSEFGLTGNESVEIVKIGKCNNSKPDIQYFSFSHNTLVYMEKNEAYHYLGQVVDNISPGNVCVTLDNGEIAWHCSCEYRNEEWYEWPYIKTVFDQCYHPEHDLHIRFNNDTKELETFQ